MSITELQALKLTVGAQDGYVLTSDADGVATWQAPGASANKFYEDGQPTHYIELGGELAFRVTSDDGLTFGAIMGFEGNTQVQNFTIAGGLTFNAAAGGGLAMSGWDNSGAAVPILGLTPGQSIRVDGPGTGFEPFDTGSTGSSLVFSTVHAVVDLTATGDTLLLTVPGGKIFIMTSASIYYETIDTLTVQATLKIKNNAGDMSAAFNTGTAVVTGDVSIVIPSRLLEKQHRLRHLLNWK